MGLVEHMPVWMRWGIYAWFSYFCEYLFSGTFIIDGLELCFGPVFSRGRDKDARQNDVQSLGMNSILFSVAESGVFGNARATDDTLLLRVMMKLLDDRQRADELMRNLKNDVMIFNKDGQGAKELRELTANYYANNDFTKVIGEIELATEELAQLVGSKVIELAENYYLNPEKEGTDTGIVRKVQRPIALLATLRLYQKNDLSHEG